MHPVHGAFILLLTLGSHRTEISMANEAACIYAMQDFYGHNGFISTNDPESVREAECLDTKTGALMGEAANGRIYEEGTPDAYRN